jgi:membrane associated rhomboid family serine protease
MLLPYTVDVPMQRVPVANWVLIAATCMISVAVWAGWRPGREPLPDAEDFDPPIQRQFQHEPDEQRPRPFPPAIAHQIQRAIERDQEERRHPSLSLDPGRFALPQLFTYVLVHGGVVHLAGNMLFLFVFGNAVNAKLGHIPFLTFYFLLGALAGELQLALQADERPILGASGAIMGIVGVFLVLYPRNEVSVLYWVGFARGGSFEMASGWLIVSYMAWDLVGTLFRKHSGIGYMAHLAGALAGIALASGLVLTRLVRSSQWEENLFETLGLQKGPEDRPAPRKRKKKKRAKLHAEPGEDEIREPQWLGDARITDSPKSPEDGAKRDQT